MKKVLFILSLVLVAMGVNAQRITDQLNRGLVAVPQGDKTGQDGSYGMTGSGIYVSWRILPSDYYDTKFNLYRNGSLVAENLSVSNYQDNSGSKTSTYKVVPVVKGVEQTTLAAECTPWDHQYWSIPVKAVVNRNNETLSGYTLNDCSVADVDGDGQMEFVVKRRNDSGNLRTEGNTTDFNLHECYKMDGTRLWWIDMGPNMMAGPDEQFDLILYDWDQDGKAEALMRGADNMIIHTSTGKTIKVGDMSYYAPRDEYTKHGKEYLLYLNGATGEPFLGWDGGETWTPMEYPLPRFEQGEAANVLKATESEYAAVWGSSDTGHRSMKHYFGAPYLDGRNASIFLGRGCYTRHKFCALDVNKETHELTQRWRWNCYDSKSPWFGNGFHNFAIADVDMDGRDEIVFGSMIIDDTGYGLSTTGYGHGDAQHCGDLDPYRWGLEQFVCLEGATVPGVAYTDGMTSTLRYTTGGGSDNGRCMAGNFYNSYPGAIGISGGAISLVADKANPALGSFGDDYVNCRIYWDGDLLDEFMDSPGVERAPYVYKAPGQTEVHSGRDYKYSRCWGGQGMLNNSSKNNPCFLGDIIGDWREEIVSRTDNALIIQTTSYPSPWGITSLWYDHEYRNAMTWQSVGYNQPPHPSFFLGEMEGITKEPPAITLEGRTEVTGTIQTTTDHLLISGYENKTIAVAEGASPYILTVNTPAWVKGTGAQQAVSGTPKQPTPTIETYTTTLTGGAFSGSTRLVKQGEGTLVLPNVVEKHTGATDVWNGTLQFDGTLETSPLWLNRHTTLISNGGKFLGGLKADYNATIYPGGKSQVGSITASALTLGFGSRIVIDANNGQFDQVNANSLTIEAKTDDIWRDFGPTYKTPVLQFNGLTTIEAGTYELGTVGEINGNVADLLVEGFGNNYRTSLRHQDGKLWLVVETMRAAGQVAWNGVADNTIWQQAVTENFLIGTETTYSADGDDITFDDNAAETSVVIKGAVSPKTVTFNNATKDYTVSGDSIVGDATFIKNGAGSVTLNNWNRIGSTTINGGTVNVAMLANNQGQALGSLGTVSSPIALNDGATLVTNGTIITDQSLTVSGETTIEVPSGKSVIFNKAIKGTGATITKAGAGSMETGTETNTYSKLVVKAGTVVGNYSSGYYDMLPPTIEFQGGTLWAGNNEGTNINNTSNIIVPAGKTGSFYGGFRSTYTGSLTGAGTFSVYTGGVRCYFNGDWSAFEGTINIGKNNRQNKASYDPDFYLGNAKGMPLATVNVNEKARLNNQGNSIVVKKFGGKGALVGNGTWIVDCDQDFTLTTEVGITSERTDDYGNTMSVSASPLTKRGTGKMKVTAGKINGRLTIENGTVSVPSASATVMLNGSNGVTVKGNGRLSGQYKVYNLTLQSGGQLFPCGAVETLPGTVVCENKITLYEGATIELIRNGSKNSSLSTNNLELKGTIKVTFLSSYTPKVGAAFTLWTATGIYSGTPTLDLPELPAGMKWDTTDLFNKTGILRIVEDDLTGIQRLSDDAAVTCEVFTLSGSKVATFMATKAQAAAQARAQGLKAGTYVIRMTDGTAVEPMKFVVK